MAGVNARMVTIGRPRRSSTGRYMVWVTCSCGEFREEVRQNEGNYTARLHNMGRHMGNYRVFRVPPATSSYGGSNGTNPSPDPRSAGTALKGKSRGVGRPGVKVRGSSTRSQEQERAVKARRAGQRYDPT